MPKRVEFFFDLSSPWTCLAFHNIRSKIDLRNADIIWRPFLVGGIHNQVNNAYVEARANDISKPKWRQLGQSLQDWAAWSGVTMNFPSQYFPLRSVLAMRFCCQLEHDQSEIVRFAEAGFDAYYTDQRNLDAPEVLVDLANSIGFDGDAMLARSEEKSCKDHLRANTDEAINRGAFGSPSIFVPVGDGERLYFGNDQLPLVEWAIQHH